jgi:hypothetical protein
MFYCVVCSQLLNEKNVESKIFEKGFYIDPFRGEKFHLGMCVGMCDKKENTDRKQDIITQNTIQEGLLKSEKIMDYLSIYHVYNDFNILL